MNSNDKIPATEARKLFEELGESSQELIADLPDVVLSLVREECGEEISEHQMEEIERVLTDWQADSAEAVAKQLEQSIANLEKGAKA